MSDFKLFSLFAVRQGRVTITANVSTERDRVGVTESVIAVYHTDTAQTTLAVLTPGGPH